MISRREFFDFAVHSETCPSEIPILAGITACSPGPRSASDDRPGKITEKFIARRRCASGLRTSLCAAAGWRNFGDCYRPLLDAWQVFDDSGDEPTLLEENP